MLGTSQEFLESADLAVLPPWRGSGDALVELNYCPLNLRLADGMPLRHRSPGRAHHFCTPTRPSPFYTSGLTSAYPPAFLVAVAACAIPPPWRIRLTPAPSGGMPVGERHGVTPFRPAVLALNVGPHSSPGVSGVSLRRLQTRAALLRAILAVADNPRRLLQPHDDSSMGSTTAYPYSALLDGIPGRMPRSPLFSLL